MSPWLRLSASAHTCVCAHVTKGSRADLPRHKSQQQLPGNMIIAPSDVMLASNNDLLGVATSASAVPTLKSVDPANAAAKLGAHSDEHIGVNPAILGSAKHDASSSSLSSMDACAPTRCLFAFSGRGQTVSGAVHFQMSSQLRSARLDIVLASSWPSMCSC